jgi:hypothetical protein
VMFDMSPPWVLSTKTGPSCVSRCGGTAAVLTPEHLVKRIAD